MPSSSASAHGAGHEHSSRVLRALPSRLHEPLHRLIRAGNLSNRPEEWHASALLVSFAEQGKQGQAHPDEKVPGPAWRGPDEPQPRRVHGEMHDAAPPALELVDDPGGESRGGDDGREEVDERRGRVQRREEGREELPGEEERGTNWRVAVPGVCPWGEQGGGVEGWGRTGR